jgi:hypothetical protein
MVSTLVPVLVISAVYIIIFLFLRLVSIKLDIPYEQMTDDLQTISSKVLCTENISRLPP